MTSPQPEPQKSEPKDQMPDFNLSPMTQSAISIFEMFRSYVEAGFTERQSLRLIAEIMVASPPSQP